MHELVLFCKSYDRDMLRARRMADSVMRFNSDKIPLILSVPEKDLKAFQKCFANIPCSFYTDESILAESAKKNGPLPKIYPQHLLQQLIKLEFWQLGLCENYLWIDSDSYFLKDFGKNEFFHESGTPYIFQKEYNPEEELKRMAYVPSKIRERRIHDDETLILKFQKYFGNSKPLLKFASAMPIMWSVAVLESFNNDHLKNIGKNIYEFLNDYPCETQIYGEYLHASKIIPIHPRPFLFKTFLYADDFYISQMQGESEYSIAKNYHGICMQSNWALIREKKKTSERLKKHFHEFLRALGFLSFKK
ncbi:MAG: hypothetical protein KKE17_01535 [Proteobacteria bacterium]|nr:hypothetical protein [Pseudomonadota bacterium]MBU1708663.1 hypothetical protein [Pseudomonadota bacterium]